MSTAFHNHGRWVAYCDADGCSGAERLWPDGKIQTAKKPNGEVVLDERGEPVRYGVTRAGEMVCGNCGHTSQVRFPSDGDEIEAVLKRRPVPETRNWEPGETVSDLKAENLSHGVGI